MYKRESGLLNPLEHLPAGVIEDAVRVEMQSDERADGAEEGGGFCDVSKWPAGVNLLSSSAFASANLDPEGTLTIRPLCLPLLFAHSSLN